MRFLYYDNEGNLSLTIDLHGVNIPPYSILSHTWSEDEVLFKDFERADRKQLKRKAGYCKLDFCRRKAALDGLQYFWVDTCCIDKSSSTELQESINSMFTWYRNAAKCYVYLSDVDPGPDPEQIIPLFHQSRWFTRSWTLQELLGPSSVEFYTSQGSYIGDKISMITQLLEITRIPRKALQGTRMAEFSVEERLSWASSREARLAEDTVYSLLGILDVHMPLLYGEGRQHAMKRLKDAIDHRPLSKTYLNPSLAKHKFRLLLLEPGILGSEIKGRIQEFDLRWPPPYYALSYVWGKEPPLHRITINDAATLVRPNLFHALQRIRALQGGEFSLWVDSLSINQDNDVERSAQVKRMAEIYKAATVVYIWLGEEDATSQQAMEHANELYQEMDDPKFDKTSFLLSDSWLKAYKVTALSLLMERPWFRRGWVIQEAAFATHSLIQCGDRQMNLKHFRKVTKLIRSKLKTQAIGSLGNMTRAGTVTNFLDSPAVRLLDLIEKVFSKTSDAAIPYQMLSLETIVHLATFSETSDERDAIYALLTLAKDQRLLSIHEEQNAIVPDYSKSTLTVYSEFIMYCYNQNGSLDILCRPWAPIPSSHRQLSTTDTQESIRLPSWICSRDKLPFGEPSWRLKHRLHGNPLVGGSSKRIYNAHGGTEPVVVREPTEHQSHILTVGGITIAEITQRSPRMANAIVTKECLLLLGNPENSSGAEFSLKIGTWWRTLCADRDESGDPAPSSWRTAMIDILDMLNRDNIYSIDVEELLDEDLPEYIRRYLLVVRDVVWNRRTFQSQRTEDGKHYVGLIPPNARNGDQICLLYGCSVPVVLRKHEKPDLGTYWQLIGDTYVHGIMDGEFLKDMSLYSLSKKEQTFEIR